jgi:hypothetical protein
VAPRRIVFVFGGAWVEVGSGIARGLRRLRLVGIVVGSVTGERPRGLAMRVACMALLLGLQACSERHVVNFLILPLLSKAVARKAAREGLVASSSDQSIG